MKKMMKKGMVLAMGLLLSTALMAQSSNQKKTMTNDEIATKQTEMMTKNLSLTSKQVEDIREVNLDYTKKMRDASSNEDRDKLASKRDAKIKKILNDDQYKSWETNQKTWTDQLKITWENVKDETKDATNKVKNNF